MMKKIIDFLPERKEFCLLIKSAFSDDFCDKIIQERKYLFKKANTHYPTSYRNNERQIVDDEHFSEKLFSTIYNYIPNQIEIEGVSDKEKGCWSLKSLNSRIRICRYLPNQYFNKHLDGVFYKSEIEQSKLTFMIYLNSHDEFDGGKTLFYDSKESERIIASYKPVKGDLIVFDHNLWHSGEILHKGEKYVLRSDIIYKKINNSNTFESKPYKEGHLGYIWKALNFNENLITSGRDKKIKIWNSVGEKVSETLAHENSIISLLKLNSNTLISASRDSSIKIWCVNEAKDIVLSNKLNFHTGTVLDLYRKNDSEFLSVGSDGIVNLISSKGKLIKSIKAHNEWVWSVSIVNEDYFLTVGEDGGMIIWSFKTFEKVFVWKENVPITSVAVGGDSCIYLGKFDGVICKLYIDFESGDIQKLKEKKSHTGIVRRLKVENKLLYSTSEDNTLKISEKDSLNLIKEFKHKNFVQDVALFKDYIISVSYDGQILKHERVR